MKRLLLPLVAAPIAMMPAHAQDAATSASWTGPYVGGHLGYGWQPKDNDEQITFDTNQDGTFGDTVNTAGGANAFSPGFCGGAALGTTPGSCRPDKDGLEWAVHAGYDRQFGSFVVGAVAEYGRSTLRDSVSGYSTTPARYTMTRRLKDNAGLRARAGYAFGSSLIYGTGGLAWGKIRNSFTTSNGANSFVDNGNDNVWGYKYGGGVEQLVAPNFSIGVEYMYTSLKDNDYRVRAGPGTAPATNPFLLVNASGTDFARSHSRFNSHAVHATASFRF